MAAVQMSSGWLRPCPAGFHILGFVGVLVGCIITILTHCIGSLQNSPGRSRLLCDQIWVALAHAPASF